MRQGLHTVLLECVGSSHALLAVKALQPSQQHQSAGSPAANKLRVQPSGRAKARIQHSKRQPAASRRQVEAGWQLMQSSLNEQSLQGELAEDVPHNNYMLRFVCSTSFACLQSQMCLEALEGNVNNVYWSQTST